MSHEQNKQLVNIQRALDRLRYDVATLRCDLIAQEPALDTEQKRVMVEVSRYLGAANAVLQPISTLALRQIFQDVE